MKHDSQFARPVRVSIPASVAADIGSLKKAMGSILDKLGCQACCSGHDIFLELQRDLVIGDKLNARALANPTRLAAGLRKVPTVNVGIKPAAVNRIDDVYTAIDRIAELSGHTACATGCDIFFQMEEMFTLDKSLNIQEQVMTIG